MAKKASTPDINMSEAIRGILTENPKLNLKETVAAILDKHPGAVINSNSVSVAFYAARKKLGIGSSGRGRRVGVRRSASITASAPASSHSSASRTGVDFAMLQSTARFLNEVGGTEAALEAIKQVQAVQVK